MKLSSAGLIKYNNSNTNTIYGLYTKYATKCETCALITLANVGIYRRFFESEIAKKYVVFDESFESIKSLCEQYKNVEFVEINTENLISKIGKYMKIDMAIMNPPWDTKTDLHVNVVKKMLDNGVKIAISVMPNDFLKTDEYNKKHSRYRNTKIDTMLDTHEELSIDDTNKLFNLSYSSNCAVMSWNANGSYNYDTIFNDTTKIKNELKQAEIKIQNLIKNDEIFKNHKKFVKLSDYNGVGYFIPIGTHGANIATEFGLIENNNKAYNYNGNEIEFDSEKFYNLKTNNGGKGIKVSSKTEGIRLLKLFRSEEYMNFQKWTKISCNGNFRHLLEFCPILKTNEQLITENTKKKIEKIINEVSK